MKLLNQAMLLLEMLVIITPISFYLIFGVGFVISSVFEQPTAENLLIGGITLISATSTVAVWYVTGAAIRRIHHMFNISNYWWALVILGFVVCVGVIATMNSIGVEYRLGGEVTSKLPAFLLGLPLAIPAIHSMFVFRYANSANNTLQRTSR